MMEQLCTFELGDFLFALEIDDVQEVVQSAEITPVPRAPRTVLGLFNLRGQIVTVIDLKQRVECLQAASPSPRGLQIVLRPDGGSTSLLVDDIGDVLERERERAAPPPRTLPADLRRLISRVYESQERSLLVLDTAELLSAPRTRSIVS